MDILEIKNFSKSYNNDKKAVDDISLSVEQGDIYGFIGHNGAGKSTTIKALAGVLDFEEGDIYIAGKSVKDNPIECKQVMAYIPDNPDLYEHLTGMQYLNFIADIFKVSADRRKKLIDKYAEIFEISDSLNDMITSYSHGMKQKLALISAFIHEPGLLVLDEPFVGLDPKATLTLKNLMKEMCNDGGAVFFSTHVLDVAEKLCNKVAIIKKGKIVASGRMEDIVKDASLEEVFMEVVEDEGNKQ